MQAFLKGCVQLLATCDDCPDTLAGLLSLHKGQSVSTGDGSVVENNTWSMERVWECIVSFRVFIILSYIIQSLFMYPQPVGPGRVPAGVTGVSKRQK